LIKRLLLFLVRWSCSCLKVVPGCAEIESFLRKGQKGLTDPEGFGESKKA
jgi:hypothetical protein